MTRVGRQNDTCGLAVMQAANEVNIILFLEQDKVIQPLSVLQNMLRELREIE